MPNAKQGDMEGIRHSISFVKAMWHVSSSGGSTGQLGGDREQALLAFVLQNAEKGNPLSVIQTIDAFATQHAWLMNIGNHKGQILDDAVRNRSPQISLELGTYCGYSALRIASSMKQPHSLLVSVEFDPKNSRIARQIIDHAGLSAKIKVLDGTLSTVLLDIKSILKEYNSSTFDFVFLDHYKECYLPDYLLLKQEKLLSSGSVIFADNLGFPGSPKFWAYLQANSEELSTVYHKCKLEYLSWIPDTVAVSTFCC